MVRAMSTALWLDFLGIRMDSRKAEGMEFTINFITSQNELSARWLARDYLARHRPRQQYPHS
jgi:alkyl sulfatase BDS1-like metallo-beta-lactamase superfamily hydrolase